nr:unnamed protein product [Digitaria exilis]
MSPAASRRSACSEDIAYRVCRRSLLRRSSIPLDVIPIVQQDPATPASTGASAGPPRAPRQAGGRPAEARGEPGSQRLGQRRSRELSRRRDEEAGRCGEW